MWSSCFVSDVWYSVWNSFTNHVCVVNLLLTTVVKIYRQQDAIFIFALSYFLLLVNPVLILNISQSFVHPQLLYPQTEMCQLCIYVRVDSAALCKLSAVSCWRQFLVLFPSGFCLIKVGLMNHIVKQRRTSSSNQAQHKEGDRHRDGLTVGGFSYSLFRIFSFSGFPCFHDTNVTLTVFFFQFSSALLLKQIRII